MQKYFDGLTGRYPALAAVRPAAERAAAELVALFRRNGTLFVAGNGGSPADKAKLTAADAEAGPALGAALQYGLPAVSLLSHPALTSAFGNDVDPELAFAQQLWALGRPGDIVLGISTGGNASNIYKTFAVARAKGIGTILLTGNRHGKCEKLADLVIAVPESETYKIQELHLPVYHTLCLAVESQFFTMME